MGFRSTIHTHKKAGPMLALFMVLFLAGCTQFQVYSNSDAADGTTPPVSESVTHQPATSTPTSTLTSTISPTSTIVVPTASPTKTPTQAPTVTPPSGFNTDTLYDSIEPVDYLADTCTYYSQRWNINNAAPGTVVVPVMYHGVTKRPPAAGDNISVSAEYFKASMKKARELGFETITIQQLVDFLHHNAYIPPRSLLLIIDDRRLGTVREHFLPVLEEYDWHLIMAYITGVANDQEWSQIKEVLASGYTELQAHGFMHNGETYITKWTSEEIIRQELFSPIEVFEEYIGKRPTAFIWPGGNFNQLSVDLAQEAGYEVAFTVYARGPIMFNWIPLGEPEREMENPLLVLPRYWSTTIYTNLDYAVEIGNAAQIQAERQKFQEIAWYNTNCPGYPALSFSLETMDSEVHDRW